jgi:hypothetical protein
MNGKKSYAPDWKNEKRKKDPKVMKRVHEKGCVCVLNCGKTGEAHHVLFKSSGGDDDEANIICLCSHHHSQVHAEQVPTLVLLGDHLLLERPDTIAYIKAKLGEEGGTEWLRRRLHIL